MQIYVLLLLRFYFFKELHCCQISQTESLLLLVGKAVSLREQISTTKIEKNKIKNE